VPRHLLLPIAAIAALVPASPGRAAPYAPGTVIAKVRAGTLQTAAAHRAGVRAAVRTLPGGARMLHVTGDPAGVAARLARAPGVRWAEPDYTLRASAVAVPDDPRLKDLYGLDAIGAPAAWSALGLSAFPATGGAPVGIVDTGIDQTHEDLAGKVMACAAAADGRIVKGECADTNGHGTHVAGTIGALANNGVGIAGVAFASPLIVCRALGGPGGSGTTSDVAACMRWVHDAGARVISMSLGGPDSRTIADAARLVWAGGSRKGSVIVAAAGNEGDATVDYPAGLAQVVSVGAVGRGDKPAPFSNRNADVEITAPGVDILSTKLGGGYVRLSGTSMATPHVSGAAALLWTAHPRSTAAGIRARLDAAVGDLGPAGRDDVFGLGRLDLTQGLDGP
jgi:subtilisin family serine protease